MRFAVIGCGVIGRHHAATIATLGRRAELVLADDEVPERADELAAEHGIDSATSAREALARPDVDAVAICTPSGLHADLAVAALAADKHVVVEKPLDVSVAAAERVRVAQARAGRTVTVISQHRFDASSQVVHRAVRDGEFGRITSGFASISWWRSQPYYDSGDWRGTWSLDGGGALMNQGIHTIDLLIWMLGEPAEVFAWSGCLAHEGIEVEDTAVATIRFASGALGVVHGTTAAYPGLIARLGVHGDRGSAVIDDDELTYLHIAPTDAADLAYGAPSNGNQADDVLRADRDGDRTAGADPAALSNAHADQYRDFLDAVAEGRPPLVTVAEATRTLAVVRAIYDSVRTGKPVAVPALATTTDADPAGCGP